MSLNKFIPLSPDPYITSDPEMTLAKFGHLNTIVDYLNAYVVVDSLQLAGSGPITATARYISDSTGVNSAISISTIGVGIGTNTLLGILHLKSTAATTRMVMDGDAGQSRIITYRTAGLQRFGLYVNNTAESGSNAGSDFAIRAYSDAGTLLSTPVFIKRSTGNVGINTLTGTAKLQVVGSGSTSATTSLLVQNSAGNSALTISDDLTTTFSNRIKIDYDTISFLGNPSNTFIQQSIGIGYMYYSSAQSHQIMINAQPKIIIKDTGASQASTLIVGHNVATSVIADASALLEVRSDATYLRGFLKPRMTTTQKNAIVTPAAGLEIFDTTLGRPCFYSGSAWVTL
jgi:hypothetical protein